MSRRYRSKSYNGRGLVSIVSYLIRQFCFPNPFTNIVKDPNTATIVNLIIHLQAHGIKVVLKQLEALDSLLIMQY